jgi:hypothetical protein
LKPCNIFDCCEDTDRDKVLRRRFIGNVTLCDEENLTIVELLTLLDGPYGTLTASKQRKVCSGEVNSIPNSNYWKNKSSEGFGLFRVIKMRDCILCTD